MYRSVCPARWRGLSRRGKAYWPILLESARMAKHSSQILQLAKRGAEVRLRELLDEMKVLTLSFPHLRDAVDRDDLPVEFILQRGQEKAGEVQATRSRRKMSAKARKAISDAQKARWAKQKAAVRKN
jgi:hypothetical protein